MVSLKLIVYDQLFVIDKMGGFYSVLQSFLLELLWRMQNRLLKKQNICATL